MEEMGRKHLETLGRHGAKIKKDQVMIAVTPELFDEAMEACRKNRYTAMAWELQIPETDGRAVNAAVSAYIAGKGRALLLCAGEKLTFARSADVKIDMNGLIRRVGRGGGRPDMASGAGVPECIGVARKILMTEGIS